MLKDEQSGGVVRFSYGFPLDIFSAGYYYVLSINKLSSKGIVIENTFF